MPDNSVTLSSYPLSLSNFRIYSIDRRSQNHVSEWWMFDMKHDGASSFAVNVSPL